MPEYRRFIAYFYEYINGKKKKNAGFAKVELRNGMWRILFRLNTDIMPEPPVQVYGFVREKGYLLGFPMGKMTSSCEIAEEWAYQADTPVGFGKYFLQDLAGIWVWSGERRCFITVWDDDPVDVSRFVLELPENAGEEAGKRPAEAERRLAEAEKQSAEAEKQSAEAERRLKEAEKQPEEAERRLEEAEKQPAETEIQPEETEKLQESAAEKAGKQSEEAKLPEKAGAVIEDGGIVAEETAPPFTAEIPGKITAMDAMEQEDSSARFMRELFRKRQHFQPFSDREIVNCIQIMPCDVARLQQWKWQTGRSSFLQHGYYQHRHLLLGTTCDGKYVLGVPGIRSQQEQYMAKLFGYDQFKMSRICDCGRVFGYWYRILEPQGSEKKDFCAAAEAR